MFGIYDFNHIVQNAINPKYIGLAMKKTVSVRSRQERIKSHIKLKFGSIRQFCQVNQFNYWTATNALNMRLEIGHLLEVLTEIECLIIASPVQTCEECINTEDREYVRITLITKWKSIQKFVDNHSQFSMTFVHNVIAGKRKNRDKRFYELIAAINA
jgi:hypothetical protein